MNKIIFLPLAAAALIASGASGQAESNADACRKAVTRACVLEASEAAADAIPTPFGRATALANVAAYQRRAGLEAAAAKSLARAEDAAKQIPADSRDGALPPSFAAAKAENGDWAGALAFAQSIEKPNGKVFALAALALAEQRHGREADAKTHFAQAIAAAGAVEAAQRAYALTLIARAQAKAGSNDAAATFDLALAADKALGKGPATAIVYQRIRAGEFDRALVDIADISTSAKGILLRQLVGALARAGKISEGATVAAAIDDHTRAVEALIDLAVANFRAGHNFEGAKQLVSAEELGDAETVPASKMQARANIAGAEAVGGMADRAKGHLDEVRAAIAAETTPIFKQTLTEALAVALARAQGADPALEALRAIDPKSQPTQMSWIADDFEAAHRPGEAFAMLNALPSPELRASQLLDLADRLPK